MVRLRRTWANYAVTDMNRVNRSISRMKRSVRTAGAWIFNVASLWLRRLRSGRLAIAWRILILTTAFALIFLVALWNQMSSERLAFNRQIRFGRQHAYILQPTADQENALRQDHQIKKVGLIRNWGLHVVEGYRFANRLTVGSIDDTAVDLAVLHVLQGRLPRAEGEAAVEQSAFAKLRRTPELGARLSLPINRLGASDDAPLIDRCDVTVVGILADGSDLHMHAVEGQEGYRSLPEVLVVPEQWPKDALEQTPRILALELDGMIDPFAWLLDRQESTPPLRWYANTAFYRPNQPMRAADGSVLPNQSLDEGGAGMPVERISGGMTVLAGAFSAVVVLMVLLTSLPSRRRRLRLLQLAGLSGDMVSASIFAEGVLESAVSCALARLISVAIQRWFPMSVIAPVMSPASSTVDFADILIAILIIAYPFYLLAAVHPGRKLPLQEGLSKRSVSHIQLQKNVQPRISKYLQNTSKAWLLWTWRSTHKNRSSLGIVIALICIAVTVILAGGAYINQQASYIAGGIPFDYLLNYEDGRYFSTLRVRFEPSLGLDPLDVLRLRGLAEIETVLPRATTVCKIAADTVEDVERFERWSFTDDAYYAPDLEAHKSEKSSYGFPKDQKLFAMNLIRTDATTVECLQPYLVNGRFDTERLRQADKVIISTNTPGFSIPPGTILPLSYLRRLHPSDQEFNDLKVERIDLPVEVIATVFLPREIGMLSRALAPQSVNCLQILSAEGPLKLPLTYPNVFMQLKSQDLYSGTDQAMRQLQLLYPRLNITSQPQQARLVRERKENERQTLLVLSILLLTVAALVFIAGAQSRREASRLAWFYLRVSGMTFGDALSIRFFELSCVMVIGWFGGLVFGLLSTVLLLPSLTQLPARSGASPLQFFPWLPAFAGLIVLQMLTLLAAAVWVWLSYRRPPLLHSDACGIMPSTDRE